MIELELIHKENQKRLIKEIQAASEERMSVLAAARKAFTAKCKLFKTFRLRSIADMYSARA